MTFAWVIKTAFEALAPPEPHVNDSTPFFTMILMDDSVLVEPDVGLRPAIAAETLETLTKTALGEKAINEEKDWEEGRYESSKIVWGLLYDSDRLTRSLPEPKLLKAAHLLNLPDFSYGCRVVDLSLVQELRGNQQFWLSAMPIISGLLGATNALLGPPDRAGRAVPRGHTPVARERTWVRFWEAVEVQRYLIGVRDEWSTTFTHPMVSAMSLQEGLAFSMPVDVFRKPLLEFVRESLATSPEAREGAEELAFEPSPDEDLIVSVTELLAVVALAAARGPEWKGKLVAYAGDNQTVGAWLEKRHTHREVPSFLLQLLTVLESVYNFRMYFAYIRTYHNLTADALTREEPTQVMRSKGLKDLGGVEGFLLQLLNCGWLKRAFIWGAQRDGGRSCALRLATLRSGVQLILRLWSLLRS